VLQHLNAREKQVLDLLIDEQGISVTEMGARLGVSSVTVRTTLNALADKGVIVRTWGGATPAFHTEILERQRTRNSVKSRIARAAAELISDGDTVMIEAGTTTAMVGRYLFGKQDIHVVTNSMLFIPYGRSNPALHITAIGGNFQAATESNVGPIALRELDQFHVSVAFVGTDGFTVGNGTTTHLVEGAEIVRKMCACAEKTVLLADSSKYGKTGFTQVLDLSEISLIITDNEISDDAQRAIVETGVQLQIAE
jgi:DeoR family transcriptional regulator, galactitol utilization operon repressor